MGRRGNWVILHGPLSIQEAKIVHIDGRQVPAVWCWIMTDRPALGGRHHVVAYGRLAQEIGVFVGAANGKRIQASINGWLRTSDEENSVVVADRITFHAPPEILAEAKRRLNQIVD